MIIVEGPDGAGKTTLIDRLAKELNLPVNPKLVNSDMSRAQDMSVWVEGNVGRGFQRLLFDRHCLISEGIYGTIARGRVDSKFDDPYWLSTQTYRFYRGCHPLIIYCLPPLDSVRRNVTSGEIEQPTSVGKNIDMIYTAYATRAAVDIAHHDAVIYDYTVTPFRHLMVMVDMAMERRGHVLPRN